MDDFFENLNNMDINLLQQVINTVIDDYNDNSDNNHNINDNNSDISNNDSNNDSENNPDENIYGCKHYLRRCKIISPCCDKIYDCRLCHDEDQYENNNDYKKKHKINRYDIKQILCTNCKKMQNSKQYCENCNVCFGFYFCNICNLFDDIDKGQYHCDKCNVCRIGGKDNYEHCDNCNICIQKPKSNLYFNDNSNNIKHKCFSIKDSLCPICMIDLFSSVEKIIQMKCGHYIHLKCHTELLKTTYKCPFCSKSIIEIDEIIKYMDNEIELTQMPNEYKNVIVQILCNDCNEKSNVKFHILGHKCLNCKSYNTRKI